MRNIPLLIWVICAICGSGCNKKKFFDGPDLYQDGFESYSALSELISNDDEKWSHTQLTKTENSISVDSTFAHSGNKSLKFVAAKSTDELSKCSIAKQNMAFWDGETMRVSAWYYLQGTQNAEWLFLFDLEEQTPVGAGPGIRLALVNNQLRMEYKFYQSDIVQTEGQEIDFPRDQWVEIIWEVKLSQKKKGSVKLWQNGQLIIDSKDNKTLPNDILYSLQGTKGMYSSIEIGATANSKDSDLILWVDDVKFEKAN
jgi:hypothetical protein